MKFIEIALKLALTTLLTLSGVLSANTYYVDVLNGSDENNDGLSRETAWRSLDQVNAHYFEPGDSILFRRGQTWRGTLAPTGSGTETDRIYIGTWGYEGEGRPHIDANGNTQAVMLKDMAYVTFEGFEISNPADEAKRDARGIYLVVSRPHAVKGVVIRDNLIRDVVGWVYKYRRFQSAAIMVYSSHPQGWFEDLQILDNKIRDVTTRGITARQDSANWRDPDTLHRNILIRGNHIDNTGCDAIRTIAMRDALIEYNVVYRVGGHTMGEEAEHIAAMFPQQSIDTVWQFNEVAYTARTDPPRGQMDSQAFDVDHNCAGTHIFQYNYTYENYGGFFLLMGQMMDDPDVLGKLDAIIVRYNVSVNDGIEFPKLLEIHPFGDKEFNVHFYNNTFHYDHGLMRIQNRGSMPLPGLQFRNNIFSAPAGSYPPESGQVYEANLYYGHPPATLDSAAVMGDPLFADPTTETSVRGLRAALRFRPSGGSPAIRAGVQIPDNGGRDFAGLEVSDSSRPDIGALQWIDTDKEFGENCSESP